MGRKRKRKQATTTEETTEEALKSSTNESNNDESTTIDSVQKSKALDKRTETETEENYAIDWESEKQKNLQFADDGTVSFFWRAHTLTALACFASVLIYVALFESQIQDEGYNSKRGLGACVLVFILVGVTVTPDGPFTRPHPVLWRLMLCLSILYELTLIYILFQTKDTTRRILSQVDPSLGKALDEKSYGGSCRLYDEDEPDNPWHNVWDKLDVFVPTHLFGWWLKTLILRDWWLCTVISVSFEILEYTLEHQLPNFSECWWDHWILDVVLCNGVGIFMGMKTLQYFKAKGYFWRGLWTIPGYKGKLNRIIGQFGPHSWIDYDWRPTTLNRWLAVLGITAMVLLAELNSFYLKYALWIPPIHCLNVVRLLFYLIWGAVGLREAFQFMDDPSCKKFGRQAWVLSAIIITETLIVLKFEYDLVTIPPSHNIAVAWGIGMSTLGAYTVWNFGLLKALAFLCIGKKGVQVNSNNSRNKKKKQKLMSLTTYLCDMPGKGSTNKTSHISSM